MYGAAITPPKPRTRSKVYWANGLALALALVETKWAILQPLLPLDFYIIFSFALPVLNGILREYTDRGVGHVENR